MVRNNYKFSFCPLEPAFVFYKLKQWVFYIILTVLNFAIIVQMGLSHSNRLLENNSKVYLVSTIGFCFTQTETNGVFHYIDSIQFAVIVQMVFYIILTVLNFAIIVQMALAHSKSFSSFFFWGGE